MPSARPSRRSCSTRTSSAPRACAVFQQEQALADRRADHRPLRRSAQVCCSRPANRSPPLEIVRRGAQEPVRQLVRRDAAHQPVRRQNLQARRMHVDEGHHHPVRAGQPRVLLAERQRRFIAVMAVGDQQLLVAHQLLDAAGAGDLPHPVHRAVLVHHLGQRRPCAASSSRPSMAPAGSGYSMKIWPKCACVARSNSSRSFFGPESVCSCR